MDNFFCASLICGNRYSLLQNLSLSLHPHITKSGDDFSTQPRFTYAVNISCEQIWQITSDTCSIQQVTFTRWENGTSSKRALSGVLLCRHTALQQAHTSDKSTPHSERVHMHNTNLTKQGQKNKPDKQAVWDSLCLQAVFLSPVS